MDYEKKYNEALKDMRAIYPNLKGDAKLAVEHAFPELRESEDERIRKALIEGVSQIRCKGDITREQMLAYLEKQKGKMTAEEFESSELFQLKLKTKYANGYQDGLAQKEQKPVDDSDFKTKLAEYMTKNRTSPLIRFLIMTLMFKKWGITEQRSTSARTLCWSGQRNIKKENGKVHTPGLAIKYSLTN